MLRRGPPWRWGLGIAFGGFLVSTLVSPLGTVVATAISGQQVVRGRPVPLAITVGGLIGVWIGLLGGVLFASRFSGSGRLSEDMGLRARWRIDLIVGALAGAGTQVVLIWLLYLPWRLADPTLQKRLDLPAKSLLGAIHGWVAILVVFIFLAVFAPLVEELFFRGLILRALAERFGPAVAVAGSAVLFGLAHPEPLQWPGLVLFGVVLAVLAHRTGRLGASIVAHATFNAITVIHLTVR